MINKEEYLKALSVVDAYKKQEYLRRLTNLNDLGLKKGDFVKYIGGSQSKYLIVDKPYRLTCEPFRNRVAIIDDSGKRKVLKQLLFSAL